MKLVYQDGQLHQEVDGQLQPIPVTSSHPVPGSYGEAKTYMIEELGLELVINTTLRFVAYDYPHVYGCGVRLNNDNLVHYTD